MNTNEVSTIVRELEKSDTELLVDFFDALSEGTRYFFHPHSFDRKTAEFLTGEDLNDVNTIRYGAFISRDPEGIAGDSGSNSSKPESLDSSNGNNMDEIMAGYVFFWDWAKPVPWLGIAVRDGYHGMGLGKILMDHAAFEARKASKEGILLTTMKDNYKAQALYKKCGYEIIGESSDGEYILRLYI